MSLPMPKISYSYIVLPLATVACLCTNSTIFDSAANPTRIPVATSEADASGALAITSITTTEDTSGLNTIRLDFEADQDNPVEAIEFYDDQENSASDIEGAAIEIVGEANPWYLAFNSLGWPVAVHASDGTVYTIDYPAPVGSIPDFVDVSYVDPSGAVEEQRVELTEEMKELLADVGEESFQKAPGAALHNNSQAFPQTGQFLDQAAFQQGSLSLVGETKVIVNCTLDSVIPSSQRAKITFSVSGLPNDVSWSVRPAGILDRGGYHPCGQEFGVAFTTERDLQLPADLTIEQLEERIGGCETYERDANFFVNKAGYAFKIISWISPTSKVASGISQVFSEAKKISNIGSIPCRQRVLNTAALEQVAASLSNGVENISATISVCLKHAYVDFAPDCDTREVQPFGSANIHLNRLYVSGGAYSLFFEGTCKSDLSESAWELFPPCKPSPETTTDEEPPLDAILVCSAEGFEFGTFTATMEMNVPSLGGNVEGDLAWEQILFDTIAATAPFSGFHDGNTGIVDAQSGQTVYTLFPGDNAPSSVPINFTGTFDPLSQTLSGNLATAGTLVPVTMDCN